MLTFEDTGVVDATHRLVVQVPDSVPPGVHHVVVVLDREIELVKDAGEIGAEPRLSPTERARDFRRWVATLRPTPVPTEVSALFSRESIYD